MTLHLQSWMSCTFSCNFYFRGLQNEKNVGFGLGSVFSDIGPIEIITRVYFWICVIIRLNPVHWKHGPELPQKC